MIVDRERVAAALPGYELGDQLGAGAFGLVLAARHRGLGRAAAVKIVPVGRRAADEARLLARLDHPHVVRVHDYVEVEAEGFHLIVMELLGGGTLARRRSGMAPQAACAVGLATAAALSCAHAAGVLHRDIKPDNVLFDAAGIPKVTDFGVAKLVEGRYAMTSAVVGTPTYMAPEQVSGGRLGPATDLYALGVVLYQLLTGAPPFDPAPGVEVLMHHHLATTPPPPAGVATPVAEVVLAALAKNPAARPPSAHAFAVDLARAAANAYGPGWAARTGVVLHLDGEVREAVDHPTPTTPTRRLRVPRTPPPATVPGGLPVAAPTDPGIPRPAASAPPQPEHQPQIPAPLWGPVPPRNLFFTGREQALDDLHARLAGSSGGEPVVAISALAGMGGVGKTQLAAEYAHRHAAAYRLVWWINAETPTQAAAGLASLADALGVPPGEPAQRQARLWAALTGRDDWLLVYDNAADPEVLAAVMPPRGNGKVLVTSRARLPRLPTLEVALFDRTESVALLHHHLPELPAADADRIAAALADLPLAVDQAGAYLAEAPIGVDAYLDLLAGQPHLVLAEATPDHAGLAGTVSAARTRLAALHPEAADLADQLAFLAPDPIPLTIGGPAGAGLAVASGTGTGRAAEGLRLLLRLALARRTGTGVQLHRLVAALLRARLDPDGRAAVLSRCLQLLSSAAPGDPADPAAWPAWAAIAPHVQAATTHLAGGGLPAVAEPEPFHALAADCAWYLYHSGQPHPARHLAASTLRRWADGQSGPGPDHAHTLHTATALAAALSGLGEVHEARELAEDTLARCRRVFGDDHPDTLVSAAVLAFAVSGLGEYRAAWELAEDTLARCRRVLGDDHPDTLVSAVALAGAMSGLGEVQAARELAEDTLARCRRVLGDDYPVTLVSAVVFAGTLAGLCEYQAARELAEDTLARCRRIFGGDHTTTLAAAVILACALAGLGEYQAVRALAGDTLARCQRVFRGDHPTTLTAAVAIAFALAGLGDYEAARERAEDTLARCRRILGDDYPATLLSAATLAEALAGLGEAQAARELAEDTLTRRRRVLGDDHPDTRRSEKFLRDLDRRDLDRRERSAE